jgi:hypothetical protein
LQNQASERDKFVTMSDIREGHDKSGTDEEINQLVEQLKAAERDLPFVGLDWFRNEFLPRCGQSWAEDPKKIDSLLWQAFERFLVLTWHVPDPDDGYAPLRQL